MPSKITLLVIAALLVAQPAFGDGVRIKLGTLVPTGTSYHKALMTMGDAWRRDSQGRVQLTVFAGGTQGGEAEMVSKMQVNSLQAAMLTAVGLSEIEPAVTGLQHLPMGFRDLREVDYVGEHLRPMLDERMAAKGYLVLFWSDAGWVRFFTVRPVLRPDDLRRLKLFTWAGSPEQKELMRAAGFRPIEAETADIPIDLQTGRIEAVPMPPFFAMASQVDQRAKFMLDLQWAPLVGACVIRRDAWERLDASIRPALLAAAAIAGGTTKANGRRESEESVAAMQKRGLTVTPVPPAVEAEWRTAAEQMYPRIRGNLIPADIFDRTLQLIAEFRAQHQD